jgi:hypothetical protein
MYIFILTTVTRETNANSNSMALVCEVSANVCGQRVVVWSATDNHDRILKFLDRETNAVPG